MTPVNALGLQGGKPPCDPPPTNGWGDLGITQLNSTSTKHHHQ
jgi:hypothetical protein